MARRGHTEGAIFRRSSISAPSASLTGAWRLETSRQSSSRAPPVSASTLNIRRPQPARRLRYVGSQARREPNQDYGRDRAPQPRDVENLFKRRRGIRGSRRRGTAVGGDMTHEDQVGARDSYRSDNENRPGAWLRML